MGTNTGLGIGIGIPFKNNALGGDKPYFPPELKARLIGVWDNYGKKNTDADRNIIKNKIPNAGGDLEILNAAYKLNSGFGEYKEDFTSWRIYPNIEVTDNVITTNGNFNSTWFIYKHSNENEINEINIKVSGIPEGGKILYFYIPDETATMPVSYNISKDGVYHLPKSKLSSNRVSVGFTVSSSYDWNNIRIEQLSDFGGAFVTDGINDMIISQKTLQEMGVTKELTIVSMIHQISWRGSASIPLTNYIRNGDTFIRNSISNIGKTGIYGYTCFNIKNVNSSASKVINNILGDKNDYIVEYRGDILSERFSVQGYIDGNGNILETSSVAHYWTFAVLGKATEDEINLIIGNYNLDRSLKPDILCNIGKQGITNDNHADFNNKLIDYSGNNRDIQMNNLAWKGGSGIAAKKFETIKDYSIIPDEGLQELTIYNEFSFKIKSIRYADRYWAVQSLNKTNISYPVTIITDKDIIWRNALNYTDADGVKGSVRKETNVPANTPTQVFIYGFNDFDISDDYTKVNCVAYAARKDITEFTVTFIPSYKGGLLLDGITDFGKVTGMPVYKDYTFIIDRKFLNETFANQVCLASKSKVAVEGENGGAFTVDNISVNSIINPYSFYKTTSLPGLNTFDRQIVFQSKYKYLDKDIAAGTATDSDTLWLGTFRDNDSRFANVAIYSLMSFPYSMSEFLIERQLKKHKLGTLYPDMVEFRPVIKANANYKITYYQIDSTNTWKSIKVGDYIVIGAKLAFQITFDNDASELKEVVSPQLSGIIVEKRPSNPGYNIYSYITSKSPQKINITIDEYIRYEDIVQPYPVIFQITDRNTNQRYSWGDKIKVGSSIRLSQSEKLNLLSGLYSIKSYEYEGETYSYNQLTNLNIILTKQSISLSCNKTWLLDDNEPKCILSPRLLRIPNSSYKILGHIPDISGHGNHGKINNSAYAEGSGVNEDGSYQFDGVDDFVTIPTVAGKQVLMKLNWQNKALGNLIYDQRDNGSTTSFAIMPVNINDSTNNKIAYQARNANGITYIDGIRNEYIESYSLENIIHNITITNPDVSNKTVALGASNKSTADCFAKMSLYDFMLFDEISTDDKIKELNEYVGIEAKVELPPYYWDTYGKTNLDADKATIQQRGVAVGDYDLTNYNHAYEGMSGYNGYPVVFGIGKTYGGMPSTDDFAYTVSPTTVNVTKFNITHGFIYSYLKHNGELETQNSDYPSYKIKVTGLEKGFGLHYSYLKNPSDANLSAFGIGTDGTYTIPKSFASDGSLINNNVWIGFIFTGTAPESCNVTIEVLPEYENGLAYDGIEDFSDNKNIPIFTDFTAIIKRIDLDAKNNNSSVMFKGNKIYESGIGNGFILDYHYDSKNYVYSYGKVNRIERDNSKIIYLTPESYNGNPIIKGENGDNLGLILGKYWKGIIYKTILYSKTISLLEINFLKNLMEKDEIIDLNNPIFIKNE
jgi:hypothetical protein